MIAQEATSSGALRSAAPLLAASLCLAVFAAGCARNAVLELEISVPAQPASGPPLYAVAVFVTGDYPFDSVPLEPQYPGTQLTSAPQPLRFSLVTERADGHVRAVVFFCRSTTCRDEDVSAIPQARFEFERGTYIGRRTRWNGEIPSVPEVGSPSSVCVDRCLIEGCIPGSGGWFCRVEDETHFCQARGESLGPDLCAP